jgi:tight adherence protein B
VKLPAWGWISLVGSMGGVVGCVLQGPVAGVLACGYATLATQALFRRSTNRSATRLHTEALDAVACLAADLRAGLPPVVAMSATLERLGTASVASSMPKAGVSRARDSVLNRLWVGWRLAESTGAPLADILDLAVEDLRAEQRHRAQSMAQLAGTRATAMILAALPLVGIGLGYAIGGDPMRILLHTPVGALCSCGALLLQVVGLVWTNRLVRHVST